MHSYVLTIILSILSVVFAAENQTEDWARSRCLNTIDAASDHLISTHDMLHKQQQHSRRHHHGSPAGNAQHKAKRQLLPNTIVVNTVAHLISSSDPYSKKLITMAMLQKQIATMNSAYKSNNMTFALVNITQHVNNSWATGQDSSMQSTLRQGGYGVLNMYFVTNITGGILGQCSMPTNVGTNPSMASIASDACIIDGGTMPGAVAGFSRPGYNLGMTAVHEVGHWNGLFHPFEGNSCDPTLPGDYISDTPVQSTATNRCPTTPAKDSCPTQPGLDAIHNYMDYSLDSCYNQFTPGQGVRVHQLWAQYRKAFSAFPIKH